MALKKGLGRGLSALIPEDDMDFLRSVARGDDAITGATSGTRTGAGSKAGKNGAKRRPATDAADMAPQEISITRTLIDENDAGQSSGTDDPLIQQLADGNANGAETASGATDGSIEWVELEKISPNPYQPRRHFDSEELNGLSESLRVHGILQPVVLRRGRDGAFELVAGERRWRAARMAEFTRIPAVVRDLDDQQTLELAIIENVQRHDISAVDTAAAYRRLAQEFHLSQEEISQRVGKSRSAVANTMRLLDLPEEIRQAISDGKISEGHGRAILMANGEGARRAIFRRVLRDQLSVRETERLAQGANSAVADGSTEEQSEGSAGLATHSDAELKDIAEHMTRALGTRLSVRPKGQRGTIQIEYSSPDELERLYRLIASLRAKA